MKKIARNVALLQGGFGMTCAHPHQKGPNWIRLRQDVLADPME